MSSQTITKTDAMIIFGENGWPQQGQWRYEDYLHLPDDGRRYEIIEGVLYVSNAPSTEHQFTAFKIAFQLELFVQQKNLGTVFIAPYEVHLSENSRPVQPDVLFIRSERMGLFSKQAFEAAPDLIVEVISPSSIRLDRYIKFNAYERYGVAEYWLVDPKARLVEVYTWQRGEYALWGQYTEDDLVTSPLLEGLAIKASLLFQPKS